MRFTTFYFSGTGNTEWTVKQFNHMIIEAGHEGEIFSIETIDTEDRSLLIDIVKKSNYIGFANPIYGGDIPPIMRSFISNFTKVLVNEKECLKQIYIINTFAYVNGFGSICAKKMFYNTTFTLISYVNIRLCNNISRPGLNMKIISEDKLDKRKGKAKEELKKLVERLLTGKRYITGIGPYLIPNIFVRKKAKKLIRDNYKAFSVDMETCSKCFLCVNRCPTHSIKYLDNRFKFLPGCTACMRCYNYCPNFSILFDGKYADPNVYKRYHGPDVVRK